MSVPEWPRKHGDVEELRADGEELAGLGLNETIDHDEQLIRQLDRGLGRAGAALSPAPPKGILVLPFSSLKAAGARAPLHAPRGHDAQ